MMSSTVKMKSVGCSVSGIFSSGAPVVEALSSFNSPEYSFFPFSSFLNNFTFICFPIFCFKCLSFRNILSIVGSLRFDQLSR